MTGGGDPVERHPDRDDRIGEPADRDGWAGEPAERPGVFVRYRDGRPQFGPGCAVFAIVASVAVIVIFLLIIHAVTPLLGGVTPR